MKLAAPECVFWFNHYRPLEPPGCIPTAETQSDGYRHLGDQASTVA